MTNKMKIFIKKGLPFLLLAAYPLAEVQAIIPEPGNLIFGRVTLDGNAVTASDSHVSLAVFNGDREVAVYTMGDNPSMADNYMLEVPMDSVNERKQNMLRTGDQLHIRYRIGLSELVVAELKAGERGETFEINLNLHSNVINAAFDSTIPDSDSDGIPDFEETARGMNPFDSADALLDNDGDGVSNLQEYRNATDFAVDDYPPTLIVPEDKVFNATGLLTEIDLGEAYATDGLDGDLVATSDGDGFYKPGQHTVIWTVSDAAGNTTTDEQQITVIPLVNFSIDQLVAEGNVVTLTATLIEEAITYPVIIPFTVSGTATAGDDFQLDVNEIQIESGLSASIQFTINMDVTVAEGLEDIVITMSDPVNAVAGERNEFIVTISEENISPAVILFAEQAGVETNIIVKDSGNVSVVADVYDPNSADSHVYSWTSSHSELVDVDGNANDVNYVIDPTLLSEGLYIVTLSVTDSAGAVAVTELNMRVIESLPVLEDVDSDGDGVTDIVEGFVDTDDDGISDYLDNLSVKNLLQELPLVTDQFLVEAEAGLDLALGKVAFVRGTGAAQVVIEDLNTIYNSSITGVGSGNQLSNGAFDVMISGMASTGQSTRLVIPQLSVLSKAIEVRVFDVAQNGWAIFTEDGNNSVYSAPGQEGYCPPANALNYTPGLTDGHWCVMLNIEEGGPNDADYSANKSISILSAVVSKKPAATPSGGGAFNIISLLILSLMLLIRRRRNL